MKIDPDMKWLCNNDGSLTIRAHFASLAMQGMMADNSIKLNCDKDYDAVSRQCVKMADHLIAELNRK